jgi:transcriptional regulator with XRE-family HTH domain
VAIDEPEDWACLVRRYRLRHGLTQARLAALVGVSQRTVSRWERGEDRPSLDIRRTLRDLGWQPSGSLIASLAVGIRYSPLPRALSRLPNLTLQAVSQPAIAKRPSVTNLVGENLAPLACGILQEMLDDRALQRAIARREIACVIATTRSVLQTPEHPRVGTWRTVITYFWHDGTLYSDAISERVPARTPLGYRAIGMDDGPGPAGR